MIRFVKGRWRKVSGPGGGRFKTAVLVCVLAAAQAAGGFAQTAPPPGGRRITVDEAVDMAIRNNLSLEAQRLNTETARRASSLRWNTFLPSVDLGAGLVRPNVGTTVTGLAGAPGSEVATALGPGYEWVAPYSLTVSPSWHLALSLQVSLSLNAAMFEQMRQTRLTYEAGLITYARARAELERDVRKSYYEMLLLKERIALLRDSYETARRREAMAQANYRNGLIPEVSYLQAQVAVENMKPSMDQAENGLRLSMAAFANNLGLPVDTEFELIPVQTETLYIPLDVAELITRAASDNPGVQDLKQQILSLQSRRKQTVLQLYSPTLSLSWNADPAFGGDPWKDNWFDIDRWNQQSGMFRLSLGVRLNTFIPVTTEGQGLKTLDDNLRGLNIGLAQAVRGTELQIYQTVYSLEQARISAESQGHTVELAERTHRMTERAYQSGASELLEVQNAALELQQARISVLEQRFNYLKGLIDLEYAIGLPFGTLSSRENAR
jgi:outer membrane protein TolC